MAEVAVEDRMLLIDKGYFVDEEERQPTGQTFDPVF